MQRVLVDLLDEDLERVGVLADQLGLSRSSYLRMVIKSYINPIKGTSSPESVPKEVKPANQMKFKTMCFNCKRVESCQKVEKEDEMGNQLGGWICDNCKIKWDNKWK